MSDPRDFAVKAQLDSVSVSIDLNRAHPEEGVIYFFTGHSRKAAGVLWSWSMRDADLRNMAANVGGVLSSVSYYKPTSPDSFLRACVGGSAADEDPTLFD
jgi:hypothetical protein